MADKTYIQFTGRLKATSQEGILAEAQQIAISESDNTNVKKYIDDKISSVNNNIGSVAGSVYRPKGSITFAGLKALTSATAGDVYNVTDAFTLGSKSYPAGSNVACLKSFSSAVTPDETYWDVLAGFVDLSPYAKTSEVNTIKGNLEKSISDNVSTLTSKVGTAQTTANEASSAASTNAGEITKVKNRVSSLEGVGAQANVIESVKVNGSALPISDKSVDVDLRAYAETTELDKRINLKIESGDKKSVSIFGGAVRLSLGTDADVQQIDIQEDVVIGPGVKIYRESDGRLKFLSSRGDLRIANVEDLNSYVQKESGKGLSSNDYTSAEKTKLAGIASSAQVNVIESVKVNGSALAVASKAVNIPLASNQAYGGSTDTAGVISAEDYGNLRHAEVIAQSLTGGGSVPLRLKASTSGGYELGLWQDGGTYKGVTIPTVDVTRDGLISSSDYSEYLQPLFEGDLVLCEQNFTSEYKKKLDSYDSLVQRVTALENLLKLA